MTAYDIPSSDWSSDVCSSDLMASLLPCRSFLCGKAPRRATGRRERPQKRPEFRATIFANRTKRHAGATSRRRSAPARGRPTAQSTRGEGRDKKGRNPAQLHTQIACQQGKERTSSGPHIAPRYCRTAICRSGEQSMSLPSPPACGRGDGGGGDRCNAPFDMRRAPCYRRRVMANTPDDLSSSAPADSTDTPFDSALSERYLVYALSTKIGRAHV